MSSYIREREVSEEEEENYLESNNKRVKMEPEEFENVAPVVDDGVDETEEQRIKKLLWFHISSDNAQVVIAALTELKKYFYNPVDYASASKNAKLFFEIGGHFAVFKAMEKHSQNIFVQEKGCIVFANVTDAHDASFDGLVAIEGPEKLLAAMKNCPGSVLVHSQAICTFVNITDGNKEVTEHLVKNLDAVFAIVASMKAFPSSKELQLWSCMALDNLSEYDHLIEDINKAGARLAVLMAAENHPGHELVGYASKATKKLWGH